MWRNASLEDKTDIEAVRKIIDNWMREDILSIFFEKLVVNAERKNFWMKYVKSMDITRMFCNASDQNILRGDYRLQNEASYGRLENSKMAGQDAPVLVMQIRDMILVEVAAGGNALYIYRRHNLEKHGLTKFLKALNGEKTLPFRIGEFKETSLDRLGSYNDEGRFFHSADWQYKLTRWLNDNGIYSA